MRLKAVLDTNVVVSGIFWKGPPFEILKAWQQGRFVSPSILEEYRRVVAELTGKCPSGVADSILGILESHSLMIDPESLAKQVCDDRDDDKFLEAAVTGKANYVVTGDAALLHVRQYSGIKIVKAAQFLKTVSP